MCMRIWLEQLRLWVPDRYDMVKSVCYITSKRDDVVTASNTVPEPSEKAHLPKSKEDSSGTSKSTSSCSWRVVVLLAVLLCISIDILLAISSLAVAIFAVVNVRSLQR